jgi:hypothetical protein
MLLLSGCMGMHQSGARISARDVQELNQASEHLATLAQQIQRVNPTWAATAIALLMQANNTIVRMQNKGAGAFARWLQKHGTQEAPLATDLENPQEGPNLGRRMPPGEEL